MKTLVAVPMKDPHDAKTRLAAALPPAARVRLALHLFHRSQDFFARHFPAFDRLVVTPSAEVARHAEGCGAQVLKETAASGLDAAAGAALRWARAAGYERLLLVPADIPVWLAGEVESLLQAGGATDVVIARAHDGGTNALLVDLRRVPHFEFRYGPDSARRHEQACLAAALRCVVAQLPFLGRDLDTADDCRLLPSADLFTLQP